jgi:hypothetical protein
MTPVENGSPHPEALSTEEGHLEPSFPAKEALSKMQTP